MAQQQQHPGMQQQQNPPPPQIRQTYSMVQPSQHQLMVRVPTMLNDDPNAHHFQHTRDIMQSLPPGVQNQINAERDPERKKQLLHAAFMTQQQMIEQQMQQQGGMGMRLQMMQAQRMPISGQASGGGMAYPNQQQMVLQQQQQQSGPTQIQRVPSQGSFGQSPGQPPSSSSSHNQPVSQQMQYIPVTQMGGGGGGPTPAHATMHHGGPMHSIQMNRASYLQQQQKQMQQHQAHNQAVFNQQQQQQITNLLPQQQQPSSIHQRAQQQQQAAAATHSSIESNVGGGGGGGLASSVNLQGGRKLMPENALEPLSRSSVGTPQHSEIAQKTQLQNEMENMEYKELMEKLRFYKNDVKRLLDRLNIDNPGEMKLKSSLNNVLQVMDGTRKGGPVTRELLKKLLSNVQTVLDQYNISRHFIIAARKLSSIAKLEPGAVSREIFSSDPWKDVRHLQISVPAALAEKKFKASVRGGGGNEQTTTATSRAENGNGSKSQQQGLLSALAESFSTKEEEELEKAAPIEKNLYKIACMDGSELALNSILSLALDRAAQNRFKIDFDDDHVPISSNCSYIHARFCVGQQKPGEELESVTSVVPLPLLLPTDYPKSPIKVAFTQTTIAAHEMIVMNNMLGRADANALDLNSLDSVLASWLECLKEANSGAMDFRANE